MQPLIWIPITLLLIYRSYKRSSLTPAGILAAALTAAAHAAHPWSFSFALLCAFFVAGTAATKVKHDTKARLTLAADGTGGGGGGTAGQGGEGPRTHVQVLANSLVASVLTLLHARALQRRGQELGSGGLPRGESGCWHRPHGDKWAADVLVVGIVANYAAVAADTLSSELGILARSAPRLVTAPWKAVARGTNGGVTLEGLVAGATGAALMGAVAAVLLQFCAGEGGRERIVERYIPGSGRVEERSWDAGSKLAFVGAMTLAGLAGSVLDSVLGALVQASVIDVRSGKVIEGRGGKKVLVHPVAWLNGGAVVGKASGASTSGGAVRRKGDKEVDGQEAGGQESRRVERGWDLLDNNGVNFAMAASVSLLAMLGACVVWEVPPTAVLHGIYAS